MWSHFVDGRLQYIAHRQTSNIRGSKYQNLIFFSFCLAVIFVQSIEAECYVANEDVVGASPTSGAPTTSEWSTIPLPSKVGLI